MDVTSGFGRCNGSRGLQLAAFPLCASAPLRENFPSPSPNQDLISRRDAGAQRKQTALVPGLLRGIPDFA